MENEFVTFKKFNDIVLVEELVTILEEQKIDYLVEKDSSFEISFVINSELNQEYLVKIKKSDFPKIEAVLLEQSKLLLESTPDDYYLFSFTDEELNEIIAKSDEWGQFDYLLAQNILKVRGKEIQPHEVDILKNQRLEELAQPEKISKSWIFAGYVSAIIGGPLGIILGYYLMSLKKTLPSGERVYVYHLNDRNHGNNILIISVIVFVNLIIFEIRKYLP